jgi:hypothetical protein
VILLNGRGLSPVRWVAALVFNIDDDGGHFYFLLDFAYPAFVDRYLSPLHLAPEFADTDYENEYS